MRKFVENQLVVATHNQGKLEEISQLLLPFGVTLLSAAFCGLPEPLETESTFVGNARIKAHAAARETGIVALADDSGICIDALGGDPGVKTADWAEIPGGRDFRVAMERTRLALVETGADEPWTAQFRCTLVLAWPDGHDEIFEGVMSGCVVWPMRGNQGHGYDPIFKPDGSAVTFGEMDRWEKNAVSHRASAFRRLIRGCFT
jgi:XTP/dITP diphosphohydrolase